MNEERVEAICISEEKGVVKREIPETFVDLNWRIREDAHAGAWYSQISLLACKSIDYVKKKLPTLQNGAFAENIITPGLDLTKVRIGEQL